MTNSCFDRKKYVCSPHPKGLHSAGISKTDIYHIECTLLSLVRSKGEYTITLMVSRRSLNGVGDCRYPVYTYLDSKPSSKYKYMNTAYK